MLGQANGGAQQPRFPASLADAGSHSAKRTAGRPSKRTPELEDRLVEAILDGWTLDRWCRQPGNPCRRTVQYWMSSDRDFCTLLARAREERFYVMLEEIIDIADNVPAERIALKRARLQIRTRLRYLALFDPRRKR
jgi:hypothetical protein